MAKHQSKQAKPKEIDPATAPEPTAKEYSLIEKISQSVPWSKKVTRTTDCPLIPFHINAQGQALQDENLDRSVPYHLRGRGDEFNILARRLVHEPSPITLVTSPPGTGKSALLDTVAAYAKRLGHAVVELNIEDLASAATIA